MEDKVNKGEELTILYRDEIQVFLIIKELLIKYRTTYEQNTQKNHYIVEYFNSWILLEVKNR